MRQIRGGGATRQHKLYGIQRRSSTVHRAVAEYSRRSPRGRLRCWSIRHSADVRGRAAGRAVRRVVGSVVGRVTGQTSVVPQVAPSVAHSVVPLVRFRWSRCRSVKLSYSLRRSRLRHFSRLVKMTMNTTTCSPPVEATRKQSSRSK